VAHHIELNLQDLNQLFNTIDPSRFPDKDLDRSAENFILSWAQEFPIDEPIGLIIYLRNHRKDTVPAISPKRPFIITSLTGLGLISWNSNV
jgi:hypothetical protein